MKTDTILIEGDGWKQCHVIGEFASKANMCKVANRVRVESCKARVGHGGETRIPAKNAQWLMMNLIPNNVRLN